MVDGGSDDGVNDAWLMVDDDDIDSDLIRCSMKTSDISVCRFRCD